MIILRDGKLVDVPLRIAEAEIAAGIAELVTDFSGVKEVDVTEDTRYGLARDPIGYSVTHDPDHGFVPRDPAGFPPSVPLPLYAVARAFNRDHAARQAELGAQVFPGKPISPITTGNEAIPEGGGVLGREPPTLMPVPRPYVSS